MSSSGFRRHLPYRLVGHHSELPHTSCASTAGVHATRMVTHPLGRQDSLLRQHHLALRVRPSGFPRHGYRIGLLSTLRVEVTSYLMPYDDAPYRTSFPTAYGFFVDNGLGWRDQTIRTTPMNISSTRCCQSHRIRSVA